jgi:hypothetical protein
MTKKNNNNNNLVSRLKSLELKIATKEPRGRPRKGKANNNKGAMVVYKGQGAYSAQQANGSYMSGNNFKLFDNIWGGSGAYKIKTNSLFKTGSQVPIMHSSDTSIRFCHREYLGEISSSVAYARQKSYSVNPGLATSFPFLAGIASHFQEYRFNGLIYHFKSTGATALVNGTNTAMGSIMMVAQYRADAALPSGKLELLNEAWSEECKTSDDMNLYIECDPRENPLGIQYIRTESNVANAQDQKFYDLCSITVASNGSQGANVVGEMWVSYDVSLKKPCIANAAGALAGNCAHYYGTLVTNALPFGVQNFIRNYGMLVTVDALLGTIGIVTTVGSRYLVDVVFHSAGSADLAQGTLTGGTRVSYFNYDAVDNIESGAISNQNILTELIEATAEQITITISVAAAGATSVDITVVQVNEDFK